MSKAHFFIAYETDKRNFLFRLMELDRWLSSKRKKATQIIQKIYLVLK